MTNPTTYATAHASSRRDGAIPVVSRARGSVGWTREIGLDRPGGVTSLLVWEAHVVVVESAILVAFSKEGRRLWSREKQAGSVPAAGNGLLYFENPGCNLNAVNARNESVLDDAPLPPIMNREFRLRLFWPQKTDFVSVAFWPGLKGHEPPEVSWRRTPFGERVGVRGGAFAEREKLAPLYVPELNRLMLGLSSIVGIDAEIAKEVARFAPPMPVASEWSADTQGTLCVIGSDGTHKVMLALSPTGEEKWRWVDREGTDGWVVGQPPIRVGTRWVYALTESRVLAIEQGKLLWTCEIKEGKPAHGSSLVDGSLLVAAGKKLLHLDAAGKLKYEVPVDGEILTPPVVDADGNIYVATATHLIQIR